MHTSAGNTPPSDLRSYRCRTRPYNQACAMDPALDSFVQLKAKNAGDALRLARLTVDRETIVIDAERISA